MFSIPPHQTKLYHLFLCLCAGDQQASCGFPEPCPVEVRKGSKGKLEGTQLLSGPRSPLTVQLSEKRAGAPSH